MRKALFLFTTSSLISFQALSGTVPIITYNYNLDVPDTYYSMSKDPEKLKKNIEYTSLMDALKRFGRSARDAYFRKDPPKKETLLEYYTHATSCADCPRELELTKDVNEVLQKMKTENPQAIESIADLDFAFANVLTKFNPDSSMMFCDDVT